jgi:ribosomal protein L7/L12
MAESGEFNLIVASVESAAVADAAKAFARAFSLDETIATQICKSAPILFAQKLGPAEIKAISGTLTDLSKLGMEFRVSARATGKLPKVNWPVRPQFTAGGSPGTSGLAFEWDNKAFVCPGCGESFLFRRVGKPARAEAPSPAAAPTNGAAAGTPSKAPARARVGVAASPAQVEGVEGVAPLAGEGESLDLPETGPVESLNLDELPDVAPAAEEPALEALPDAEPLPEPAAAEEPLLSEPVPAAAPEGEFSAAAEEAAPAEEPVAEPVQEEVIEEAPAPAPGEDLYNVFLSKITDTSKRDKAADLIAKIKGCSASEAKELTTRLVIPLAKNVAKAKAEDILNQFKKLKIFGRMTKVK